MRSKHLNTLVLIERKFWGGCRLVLGECIAWTRRIISSYLSRFLDLHLFLSSCYNSSYTISLVVLMFPKDFLSEVIYGLYSSGWLDNNYQILMVTFSNWLTCDALFWFIEFLFEITSSDQRAHSLLTTFCSTSHLLSIAQGCCSHNNTTERAFRRDFTFKSRGRKSFQNVRDKKSLQLDRTDNILCRGRRLTSTNSISKCFETITSKHQRAHLKLWPLIG